MEKKELLQKLEDASLISDGDPEVGHMRADDALLDFINDEDVTKAWNNIRKWFA